MTFTIFQNVQILSTIHILVSKIQKLYKLSASFTQNELFFKCPTVVKQKGSF